ncbi:hypothetical protein BG004_007730, partial [Podila humilis]
LKILDIERCFGVELNEAMKELSQMEYLWRVGWTTTTASIGGGGGGGGWKEEDDMADEEMERVLEFWKTKAPKIRIGPIGWDEYYV